MPTKKVTQNTETADMKPQLEKRIAELKAEFESGQKMLADLQGKTNDLQATLLRISGAIQVLEEMLMQPETPKENKQ